MREVGLGWGFGCREQKPKPAMKFVEGGDSCTELSGTQQDCDSPRGAATTPKQTKAIGVWLEPPAVQVNAPEPATCWAGWRGLCDVMKEPS